MRESALGMTGWTLSYGRFIKVIKVIQIIYDFLS